MEGRVCHRRLFALPEGPEQHDDRVQPEDFSGSPWQPELVAGRLRQVLARHFQPVVRERVQVFLQGAGHAVQQQTLD